MTTPVARIRRSPWPGPTHQADHRWRFETARDLVELAGALRTTSVELISAHRAGWFLAEPVLAGRLTAGRASRRNRARRPPIPLVDVSTQWSEDPTLPGRSWRVRVVDEPPVSGAPRFELSSAVATPSLQWDGERFAARGGPAVDAGMLDTLTRQVSRGGLRPGNWGLVRARVGPAHDLVADGSALRLHAVAGGRVVRTQEAIAIGYAAARAGDLDQVAGVYVRLAHWVDDMLTAGGRLGSIDDGVVLVDYPVGR